MASIISDGTDGRGWLNANEVPLIGEEGAAAAAVEISFLKTLHSLLGLDFVNNISPLRFLLRVERGGEMLWPDGHVIGWSMVLTIC